MLAYNFDFINKNIYKFSIILKDKDYLTCL